MKHLVATTCLLALSLAASARAGETRVEDLLPADAMASLCYYGDNADIDGTALAQLLREPEMAQWLSSVQQLMAGGNQFLSMFLKVNLANLRPLLGCQVGAALVPRPAGAPGPPNSLLVAKVGGPDALPRRSLEVLLNQIRALVLQPGGKIQVEGVDFAQLGAGPMGFLYGFKDDFLLFSDSQELLARALAADSPRLAKAPAFQRAAKMSGTPVVLLLYNNAGVMERYGAMLPPPVQAVMAGVGLHGVRDVVLRLGAKGREMVGGALIQTVGERQGLFRVLASTPVDRALLKLIPRDSAMASAANVDAAQLYNAMVEVIHAVAAGLEGPDVRAALRDFEEGAGVSLGRDVFGAMGQGTVVATSGESLLPALIVSQAVKDGDRLEAALGKLVAALDRYIKAEGGPRKGAELRTIQFGNHTIRYLATPGVPVPVAPCFARAGDRIIFALTPIHLKDYLAFLDAGEPTLLDNPGFKALEAELPPNAAAIAYSDTGAEVVRFYQTFGPLLTTLQGIPGNPVPFDLANMPATSTLRKHLFGALSCSVATDDSLLIECHSPFGVSVIAPAPPVIVLGIAAGMVLPALARARDEARRIRDRNNLNQIAKGMATYLNEFGDNRFYPASLADLWDKKIIPDPGVFVSPLDPNPPKLPNGLACSYITCFDAYPNRVFRDDFPPNVIMGWNREPIRGGWRNVLFFDSHVEFMAEDRFQEQLKQLDELVKRGTTERKPDDKKPKPPAVEF